MYTVSDTIFTVTYTVGTQNILNFNDLQDAQPWQLVVIPLSRAAPWKHPVELFAQLNMVPTLLNYMYLHNCAWIHPPKLFAQFFRDPASCIVCKILHGSTLLNYLHNSAWIHPPDLFAQLLFESNLTNSLHNPA